MNELSGTSCLVIKTNFLAIAISSAFGLGVFMGKPPFRHSLSRYSTLCWLKYAPECLGASSDNSTCNEACEASHLLSDILLVSGLASAIIARIKALPPLPKLERTRINPNHKAAKKRNELLSAGSLTVAEFGTPNGSCEATPPNISIVPVLVVMACVNTLSAF